MSVILDRLIHNKYYQTTSIQIKQFSIICPLFSSPFANHFIHSSLLLNLFPFLPLHYFSRSYSVNSLPVQALLSQYFCLIIKDCHTVVKPKLMMSYFNLKTKQKSFKWLKMFWNTHKHLHYQTFHYFQF